MKVTFYEYPKCSTCRNGKAFLEANGVEVEAIDMIKQPPSVKTLQQIIEKSNLPIQKFFNSRGMKYKELGLKDKLNQLTDIEKIELLSSDGMLIKRPLVVSQEDVVLGFKEADYQQAFLS
ncbi:arsenate reductase family protein [Falseniella ignava]|uniref:Spx/MgsR family transcriptional regulator n=1 Tax=Falseniella ignava CCUG 37419 TaxID=883112 RepID=K1LPR1_9LACT|nr:arsenate reductase family protein [Falseniella ignava]EKB58975.1 spx/MgsR family transcriptional regulator [Falseniella ignava CCUG 37419]